MGGNKKPRAQRQKVDKYWIGKNKIVRFWSIVALIIFIHQIFNLFTGSNEEFGILTIFLMNEPCLFVFDFVKLKFEIRCWDPTTLIWFELIWNIHFFSGKIGDIQGR